MSFWGLADHSLHEVIEFYASAEEAEQTLKLVLADEPDWAGMLEVVEIDLGRSSDN